METAIADRTYARAVAQGDYNPYVGNLFGKYDNVRIYWEDQLTRMALRPFLSELVASKRKDEQNEKIRIVDLGCGTGQGYEILTRIDKYEPDLRLNRDRVLPEDEVGFYLGLDLSQPMVEMGAEIFQEKPQVRFVQADLRDGLAAIRKQEPPFDIYFSSYGSLSHMSREHLVHLLKDIFEHGRDGSLVVLDLMGRYSIEWPSYWSAQTEEEKMRDYSMSYLHSESGWDEEVEHFPIRFWIGAEIDELVDELRAEYDLRFEVLGKFDRSIMVGRHVDTGEYNPRLKPIRRTVNRLHEDYMRTDLSKLIVDRKMFPRHPEPQIFAFFDELIESWNVLVEYCQQRLERSVFLADLKEKNWSQYSTPLQFALMTVDRTISGVEGVRHGDPRTNIVDSQLGYALRSLEADLQRGLGCGHGLLAILKIVKRPADK